MFHVAHLLARLRRAIQYDFSYLDGAQFIDFYICLPNTHSVSVYTNHPISLVYLYLSLQISIYVLFLMFHVFPRQRAPIGPAE